MQNQIINTQSLQRSSFIYFTPFLLDFDQKNKGIQKYKNSLFCIQPHLSSIEYNQQNYNLDKTQLLTSLIAHLIQINTKINTLISQQTFHKLQEVIVSLQISRTTLYTKNMPQIPTENDQKPQQKQLQQTYKPLNEKIKLSQNNEQNNSQENIRVQIQNTQSHQSSSNQQQNIKAKYSNQEYQMKYINLIKSCGLNILSSELSQSEDTINKKIIEKVRNLHNVTKQFEDQIQNSEQASPPNRQKDLSKNNHHNTPNHNIYKPKSIIHEESQQQEQEDEKDSEQLFPKTNINPHDNPSKNQNQQQSQSLFLNNCLSNPLTPIQFFQLYYPKLLQNLHGNKIKIRSEKHPNNMKVLTTTNPNHQQPQSLPDLSIVELEVNLGYFIVPLTMLILPNNLQTTDTDTNTNRYKDRLKKNAYNDRQENPQISRISQYQYHDRTYIVKKLQVTTPDEFSNDEKRQEIKLNSPKLFKRCEQREQQDLVLYAREVAVAKLFNALQIGPKLQNIFGFDLVKYPQYYAFSMEKCHQISNLPQIFPSFNLDHLQNLLKQSIIDLIFIHQLSFIHGDLKPENIMYSPTHKKIVLIDFGQTYPQKSQFLDTSITRFHGTKERLGQELSQILKTTSENQLRYQRWKINEYVNDMEIMQKFATNTLKQQSSRLVNSKSMQNSSSFYQKYSFTSQTDKPIAAAEKMIFQALNQQSSQIKYHRKSEQEKNILIGNNKCCTFFKAIRIVYLCTYFSGNPIKQLKDSSSENPSKILTKMPSSEQQQQLQSQRRLEQVDTILQTCKNNQQVELLIEIVYKIVSKCLKFTNNLKNIILFRVFQQVALKFKQRVKHLSSEFPLKQNHQSNSQKSAKSNKKSYNDEFCQELINLLTFYDNISQNPYFKPNQPLSQAKQKQTLIAKIQQIPINRLYHPQKKQTSIFTTLLSITDNDLKLNPPLLQQLLSIRTLTEKQKLLLLQEIFSSSQKCNLFFQKSPTIFIDYFLQFIRNQVIEIDQTIPHTNTEKKSNRNKQRSQSIEQLVVQCCLNVNSAISSTKNSITNFKNQLTTQFFPKYLQKTREFFSTLYLQNAPFFEAFAVSCQNIYIFYSEIDNFTIQKQSIKDQIPQTKLYLWKQINQIFTIFCELGYWNPNTQLSFLKNLFLLLIEQNTSLSSSNSQKIIEKDLRTETQKIIIQKNLSLFVNCVQQSNLRFILYQFFNPIKKTSQTSQEIEVLLKLFQVKGQILQTIVKISESKQIYSTKEKCPINNGKNLVAATDVYLTQFQRKYIGNLIENNSELQKIFFCDGFKEILSEINLQEGRPQPHSLISDRSQTCNLFSRLNLLILSNFENKSSIKLKDFALFTKFHNIHFDNEQKSPNYSISIHMNKYSHSQVISPQNNNLVLSLQFNLLRQNYKESILCQFLQNPSNEFLVSKDSKILKIFRKIVVRQSFKQYSYNFSQQKLSLIHQTQFSSTNLKSIMCMFHENFLLTIVKCDLYFHAFCKNNSTKQSQDRNKKNNRRISVLRNQKQQSQQENINKPIERKVNLLFQDSYVKDVKKMYVLFRHLIETCEKLSIEYNLQKLLEMKSRLFFNRRMVYEDFGNDDDQKTELIGNKQRIKNPLNESQKEQYPLRQVYKVYEKQIPSQIKQILSKEQNLNYSTKIEQRIDYQIWQKIHTCIEFIEKQCNSSQHMNKCPQNFIKLLMQPFKWKETLKVYLAKTFQLCIELQNRQQFNSNLIKRNKQKNSTENLSTKENSNLNSHLKMANLKSKQYNPIIDKLTELFLKTQTKILESQTVWFISNGTYEGQKDLLRINSIKQKSLLLLNAHLIHINEYRLQTLQQLIPTRNNNKQQKETALETFLINENKESAIQTQTDKTNVTASISYCLNSMFLQKKMNSYLQKFPKYLNSSHCETLLNGNDNSNKKIKHYPQYLDKSFIDNYFCKANSPSFEYLKELYQRSKSKYSKIMPKWKTNSGKTNHQNGGSSTSSLIYLKFDEKTFTQNYCHNHGVFLATIINMPQIVKQQQQQQKITAQRNLNDNEGSLQRTLGFANSKKSNFRSNKRNNYNILDQFIKKHRNSSKSNNNTNSNSNRNSSSNHKKIKSKDLSRSQHSFEFYKEEREHQTPAQSHHYLRGDQKVLNNKQESLFEKAVFIEIYEFILCFLHFHQIAAKSLEQYEQTILSMLLSTTIAAINKLSFRKNDTPSLDQQNAQTVTKMEKATQVKFKKNAPSLSASKSPLQEQSNRELAVPLMEQQSLIKLFYEIQRQHFLIKINKNLTNHQVTLPSTYILYQMTLTYHLGQDYCSNQQQTNNFSKSNPLQPNNKIFTPQSQQSSTFSESEFSSVLPKEQSSLKIHQNLENRSQNLHPMTQLSGKYNKKYDSYSTYHPNQKTFDYKIQSQNGHKKFTYNQYQRQIIYHLQQRKSYQLVLFDSFKFMQQLFTPPSKRTPQYNDPQCLKSLKPANQTARYSIFHHKQTLQGLSLSHLRLLQQPQKGSQPNPNFSSNKTSPSQPLTQNLHYHHFYHSQKQKTT